MSRIIKNVLSLFDGMSCGQIALNVAGVEYENYYASEINNHTQKASKALYPNTIYIGDVRNVNANDLPFIDLVIGGSPCTDFSFAGSMNGLSSGEIKIEVLSLEHYLELKQEGFIFTGQSYLFWEYVRILRDIQKQNPNVLFLLENVYMHKKWELIISNTLGIRGIRIDSSLVSAQSRKRIYWSNIKIRDEGFFNELFTDIPQPNAKKLVIKDILEFNVPDKYYLSKKMVEYFKKRASNFNNGKVNIRDINGKASCLTASMSSNDISDNYIFDQVKIQSDINKKAKCLTVGGHGEGMHFDMDIIFQMPRGKNNGGFMDTKSPTITSNSFEHNNYVITRSPPDSGVIQLVDNNESGGIQPYQQNRVYHESGKSPALLAEMSCSTHAISDNRTYVRRFTPRECARLQTIPEPMIDIILKSGVSDTQLYKMFGNGWTIDVIAHILSFI